MGLFGDIEPVPYRLLDELEAQMEANRERLGQQQDLKGMTRPRPQRSIFNANMSSYRRPEPAAHPRGGAIAAVSYKSLERPLEDDIVFITQRGNEYSFANSTGWDDNTFSGWLQIKVSTKIEETLHTADWPFSSFFESFYGNSLAQCGYSAWTPASNTYDIRYGDVRLAGSQSFHVIPTGGDAGIVMVRRWQMAWSTESQVITSYYDEMNVSECAGDEFGRCLYLRSEYFSSVDSVSLSATLEGAVMRAFVFNSSTVREVPVTGAALSALSFWAPTFGTTASVLTYTEGQNGAIIQGRSVCYDIDTRFNTNTVQDHTFTVNTVTPQAPAGYNTEADASGLRRQYGLLWADLNHVGPFASERLYSPAAFSIFQRFGNTYPTPGSTENTIYQDCRSSHLDGVNVPTRFVGMQRLDQFTGDSGETRRRYQPRWAPTTMATTSEVVSTANMPQVSHRIIELVTFQDGRAFRSLIAWDWGKPGYCREQALALGFSEADLRP